MNRLLRVWGPVLLIAVIPVTVVRAADDSGAYVVTHPPWSGPLTYRDAESGITFYVESDGRHVAAINEGGKLLWIRDPFVEAKLEPYHFDRPQIVDVGVPLPWMVRGREGRFIVIRFDSTQTGIMNIATGDFIFMGQD